MSELTRRRFLMFGAAAAAGAICRKPPQAIMGQPTIGQWADHYQMSDMALITDTTATFAPMPEIPAAVWADLARMQSIQNAITGACVDILCGPTRAQARLRDGVQA